MANPNDGNDQPAPDQNTPDQTIPKQQNQTVMGLLTTMHQAMNDDRTTMRQFMGNVTRQLANPLAPIESLCVNLRNSSDGDASQNRVIHIGVNPHVEEASNPEQYWESRLNEMSPEGRRRYLAFIGSRINVVPGVPPQVPGGEGTSVSSQDNTTALLNTKDSRIRELEEELRQALARPASNTSAPQSHADPTVITQMQPSAAAERVTSAVPEVSRPSVQKPKAQQPTVKSSDRGKGPAVHGVVQRDPDRSGESRDEVVEEENANIASSSTKKPTIQRQSSTNTASGSVKPGTSTSTGRRNTLAETQSTGLDSRDTTLDDTGERKRKNERYQLRNLNAVKNEKATDFEIDNDPNRETFVGYTNITEEPPQNDFQAGDPDATWKKPRKGRTARQASSEATDGAQNSTLVPPQNRGRAKSSPSLTTAAARPASISASRVPESAEDDRSDDDEQPRKHRKVDVPDDNEEESKSGADASSSSSEEEDDDGQGAQIRNCRPSDDSGDGDESRNAPRARQHAGPATSRTTQSNKSQQVEGQDRQNAPFTTTRAQGPQSEAGDSDNDDPHNQETSQRSNQSIEDEEVEAADLLTEAFGSNDGSSNSAIPDRDFDQSFRDDTIPRPTNEDQDGEGEERNLDNWEDGVEAKNSDEAHIEHRRHPSSITKHNNARQPSTANFREKRGPQSSRVEGHADDRNNSEAEPAMNDKKRKANSSSQAAESDEEEEIRQSPEKKRKSNKAKSTPGPKSKKRG